MKRGLTPYISAAALAFGLLGGCAKKAAPEPTAEKQQAQAESKQSDQQKKATSAATAKPKPKKPRPKFTKRKVEAKPVATVKATPGDPHKGEFTLKDATKGLAGDGKLMATIDTELGKLECELFADKSPITVANFVGLARGNRAWRKDGKWVKQPLYDGTVFHRVVKGFMIQGGDPNGNGSGGPGYVIPDEIWEDAHHDQRGQLCMANRGPNTNGSQFFIMDGAANHLDGGYTIFGQCSPEAVVEKLSAVPVRGQKSVTPTKIRKVTVQRAKK